MKMASTIDITFKSPQDNESVLVKARLDQRFHRMFEAVTQRAGKDLSQCGFFDSQGWQIDPQSNPDQMGWNQTAQINFYYKS